MSKPGGIGFYRKEKGWVRRRSDYAMGTTEQWWPDDGVAVRQIMLSVMRQASKHCWLPEPGKYFVVDHVARQPGDRSTVIAGPFPSLKAAKVALLLARSSGQQ